MIVITFNIGVISPKFLKNAPLLLIYPAGAYEETDKSNKIT